MRKLILTALPSVALAAAACGTAPPPPPAGGSQPTAEAAPQGGPQLIATSDATAEPAPIEPPPDGQWGIAGPPSFASVVDKVTRMVSDQKLRAMASRRKLSLVNVMWEDTGRAQGSSLGPNISDLSLQVRFKRPGQRRQSAAVMPVIRHPNFSDKTGDVPANKFFLRLGNHKKNGKLETVALKDVLRNVRRYLSKPSSVLGSGNLLAKRDSHFLVSAQAVFLPIPKQGKAEFTPVLFNYQSAPKSPAVLSILATRQGTSIQVIENRPGDATAAGWGQELFFNKAGQRAPFTAERRTDVKARIDAKGGPKSEDDKSALAKGADVLFLVQIPLKHKQRGVLGGMPGGGIGFGSGGAMPPPMSKPQAAKPKKSAAPAKDMDAEESDVEQAVLGHGKVEGPFIEGNRLKLVRDPKFPIRITVQFYKATSNGVVNESDFNAISRAIGSVYEHADFVGSLVVPMGDPKRPTSWQKTPSDWFPW